MSFDTKTQAIFNALSQQRNSALDALAVLIGEFAEAKEQIAALEKQVEKA